MRRFGVALALFVLVASLGFPNSARAMVADITFERLVAESDLVVLARVTKVEPGPIDPKPADEFLPPPKVATAEVVQTWKGAPVREVRYFASPTWTCDTSTAKKGELVILFLELETQVSWRRNDPRFLWIAHSGRGRMPLRDMAGKAYAEFDHYAIILPEGTRTLSETKERTLTFPATKPGKAPRKAPTRITLPFTETFIELGTLREMVKANAHRRPQHDGPK